MIKPSQTKQIPGRSLNQSRFMFEELRRTTPTQSFHSGPLGLQTPLSAPPPGLKRSFQLEAPFLAGREIRPKPFPPAGAPIQPSTSEPPAKRKRGRPTKAQVQAKADAEAQAQAQAQARGAAAGPAGPAAPQLLTSPQTAGPAVSPGPVPVAVAGRPEEARPATRMPISAVLTPTAPKTASSSSSSSGKRRRGRSTRSEAEGFGGGGVVGQEYESPYGRAMDMPEDSPARTAVMRHREELGPPQPPTFGPTSSGS